MLTFRSELKKSDIETVRHIVTSTEFFEGAPDEIDVAVELIETALKEGSEKSGYYFLFAEEDGVPVAYSCFGPIPCTNHSFDLYWLATLKNYQKKGIGRNLLQQSFQCIKGMGGQQVYIETSGRAQYYPTQMFYKSCGLVQEACLKDYYDTGDDCLIFSYKIK